MNNLNHKVMLYMALVLYSITIYSCMNDQSDSNVCHSMLPDTVLFQQDIIPVLHSSCSIPDCHSGNLPTGNLNLEDALAYQELTQPGSGYINTGNPKHSILYIMLNSNSQPMPPDGKLDPCEIETVLRWIEQGAQNN